jgi:hypothetical protein
VRCDDDDDDDDDAAEADANDGGEQRTATFHFVLAVTFAVALVAPVPSLPSRPRLGLDLVSLSRRRL